MNKRRPLVRQIVLAGAVASVAWVGGAGQGLAAQLMAENGMLLEGQLGYLSSVAENPLVQNAPAGGVDVKQIVLLDDGLRRTYLSWLQVQPGSLRESDPTETERIKIRQNVARGRRRVGSVSAILGAEPFDEWGRRTFSIRTNDGRVDIVQGITEVTPLYARLQGLNGSPSIQWDSRIATSSIPRETLSRLLRYHSNAEGSEGRLKIVRLLFAAGRYHDARLELLEAMREYPELAELQELLVQLRQLSAQRLVEELQLRRSAGQHRRVLQLVAQFPAEGVAGETLLRVNEIQKEYQRLREQIAAVKASLTERVEAVQDGRQREELQQVSEAIGSQLTFNTIGRVGDYLRLADDAAMPPENKLALLVSGWYLDVGAATQNLAEALSIARTEPLVRAYLLTADATQRQRLLEQLGREEGGTPQRIAQLLAAMTPPQGAEGLEQLAAPGHFRIRVERGSDLQAEYEIQLPDEYDPYRRYPVIVTLAGAGHDPSDQIDWWAGKYNERLRTRTGQAMRHGYIVVAPKWKHDGQGYYEFSTREHAAVLLSLRDACRRFSLDTDRVYLSGHFIGGDAAWDIGLAHPDLWAGVMPICAVAHYGRNSPGYISRYWENARYVPLYFVVGELDGDTMQRNGRDFDRYLTHSRFDTMVVEYIGRGREHFYEEIHRLFTWMGLHKRDPHPEQFEAVSMRPFDNFFWYLELDGLPDAAMVGPLDWPTNARATRTEFRRYVNERLMVKTAAKEAIMGFSPQWISLDRNITITVNGRARTFEPVPEVQTLLEDARTRGDRQHPYWMMINLPTGR